MILEFTIANMLSFKNKTTFSMLANTSNGLNENYVTIDNKRILKTSAIYGGNASGKSNLFKILANMINMLKNSNMYMVGKQMQRIFMMNIFTTIQMVEKPKFLTVQK